jgi:hypothetical protein
VYDGCVHDTDCDAGTTCACHGTAYVGNSGNQCIPSNCRVDSDCGVGGYCSPTYDTMSCGSIGGYYCHTPLDGCIDDTDCPSDPSMPGTIPVCTYSTTDARWECAALGVCAVPAAPPRHP